MTQLMDYNVVVSGSNGYFKHIIKLLIQEGACYWNRYSKKTNI